MWWKVKPWWNGATGRYLPNGGCIPTKALIKSAEVYRTLHWRKPENANRFLIARLKSGTIQKLLDNVILLSYTRKCEVSLSGGEDVKEDKKELIRETAIEVIANLGFYNATTDRIAAEAGVSVGTIYNYFRNKEAILEYIFEVELDKRRTYLKKIQQESLSLRDKVKRLLTMHFAAINQNPAVGKILAREHPTPLHNDLSTKINDFLEGIPAQISKLLDEGVESGEIRPCNTQIVAVAIFGAVSSVVLYAVGQGSEQERVHILQQAACELVDLYFQGLKF